MKFIQQPQSPAPSPRTVLGDGMHVAALDHALRLARSAHVELGVALAVQSADAPRLAA